MLKHLNARVTITGLLFAFLLNTTVIPPGGVTVYAQGIALPAPGQMVALSPAFSPAVLKGIQLDPKNPFRFHFFVDTGDQKMGTGSDSALRPRRGQESVPVPIFSQEQLKAESSKLIKYFLASLTIPEKDLWVNLSPYEKNRIVPQEFGQTEMGRDLLAEDYMLKQITASLIYPEDRIGREFWNKVYAQAQAKYGTTDVPINTFNKVWIVPEKAVVYENNGTAFVLENHLKVMLEQDYLSLTKHIPNSVIPAKAGIRKTSILGSQIIHQLVLPQLEKEVNEGKNFSQLRQVFYSLILATWYKKKINDSILNKIYSDRKKTNGLVIPAKAGIQNVEYIYHQYLQAFKKGVFNYIQEESLPDGQVVPRRYFSGGLLLKVPMSYEGPEQINAAQIAILDKAQLTEIDGDMAMSNQPMDEPGKIVVSKRVIPLCTFMHNHAISQVVHYCNYAKKPFPQDIKIYFQMFSPDGKELGSKKDLDIISVLQHAPNFNGKNSIELTVEANGLTPPLAQETMNYLTKVFETYDEEGEYFHKTASPQMLKTMIEVIANYYRNLWHFLHADLEKVAAVETARKAAIKCEETWHTFYLMHPDIGDSKPLGILNNAAMKSKSVTQKNQRLSGFTLTELLVVVGWLKDHYPFLFQPFFTPPDAAMKTQIQEKWEKGQRLVDDLMDALAKFTNYGHSLKSKNFDGVNHLISKQIQYVRDSYEYARHTGNIMKPQISNQITETLDALREPLDKYSDFSQAEVLQQWAKQFTDSYKKLSKKQRLGLANTNTAALFIQEGSFTEEFAQQVAGLKESLGRNKEELKVIVYYLEENSKNSAQLSHGSARSLNDQSRNNNGGIDFNPAQMSMQVKKEGSDFKFQWNGQTFDTAQITGATFTIETMTPVTNLPQILGLNQPAPK